MADKTLQPTPPTDTAPESRALVPIDPLRHYLAEVQRYPYLTEPEERELVRRMRDEGDVTAARALVQSHLRLVVKIAMEYRSAYYNLIDLIQEGSIGLLVATKKYDPDKGARLGHYATWWIRSYVLKYLLDNFRMIRIGTTKDQRKLFYNLMKEKRSIEAQGFKPEAHLLAGRLGVTVKDIEEMSRRLEQPELALEAPVGHSEGSATFGDFVADDDVPTDEKLATAELKDVFAHKLTEFVGRLKERDRQIFQERLLSEVPRTLQDMADEFGITKERVRQLEARVLDKLREYLQKAGVSGDLEALMRDNL